MKNHLRLVIGFVLFATAQQPVFSQNWSPAQNPTADFQTLRQHFYDYWQGKTPQPGQGYSVFKRWEWLWQSRLMPDGSFPPSNIKEQEWDNYLAAKLSTEAASAANWTSMGPNSSASGYNGIGRVNCIVADPNNSNTIYVGVPTGGLWKTTNGGTTWTPLTDNLTVLSTTALVVDPTNPDIIYLGTGDGFGNYEPSIGVLKSTDGGLTWNTTGLSWNLTNFRYIRYMIINPDAPNIVVAATSDGVYRTTNGGTTWTKELNGNFYDVKFKPGDPNTVYAASLNTLYKSTNGGDTFTTSQSIPTSGRVVIAVTPANPEMVAAASSSSATDTYGAFNGLYVSTNSGSTYTLKSSTPNILDGTTTGSNEKGQGWYDFCIAISATDPDLIFVGGVNLWKSTNGGTSWTLATHWTNSAPSGVTVMHADKHALNWTGNTLYSGNDGGIYKTTNNGTSWTYISGNLVISQMYRLGVSQSDNKVITGLQDNGTKLRSTTGTWTDNIGGDGMECFIHPTNSNIMYGETQNGILRRSTNGGNSWTNIYNNIADEPDGAWVTPFVMDPNNSSTIYAGYNDVYKSTNQGNSWTVISSLGATFDLQHIAVAPTNSNVIYACDGDQVYKTTNGGTNWSNVTGNLPTSNTITYLSIDPADPDMVYVTFGGYTSSQKVYQTSTGGNTWTSISAGLPNIPANCVIVQPNSNGVLYLGMDVGVYRRDAGATTWALFNTGLPNVIVTELEIRHSTGKIRAATYGRGLWESDLEPLSNVCATPLNLSATDLEPRSGTLNWGTVNSATAYNVDLRVVGDPNWYTFSNIAGTSLSLVYFTPCTNYEFRVQAVCPDNSSNYSFAQTFSIPGCSNYCASYGIDTLIDAAPFLPDEWIENVNFGSINNTSGNDWGYNDYTNLSTTVMAGNAYTINLTPGFSADSYVETWSVWVDWNRDNDFEDADELVFTHPGSNTAVTGTVSVPMSATTGSTRMRVSMKWDALAEPCGQHIYAEIEDYTLDVQGLTTCNTPANLSVTGITERTATINWGAVAGALSYKLETREQGNAIWSELPGITANDYFLIYLKPCTNYEVRVQALCPSGASNYSNIVNFSTTGCSNYCPAYGEDSTPLPAPDEWIENVNIGSINNTSGNNWGYADYTNLSTDLTQGSTYTINLTPGFSASSYAETWSVWVDWNQDNDFEDAGEFVFGDLGSISAVSGTFSVPPTASLGTTRMRVNMKWDVLAPNPCEAPFDFGEVEDYTVNITQPSFFFTINPNNLNFPATGNSQTATVTTNCDWSLLFVPPWLTVNPTSGTGGTTTLTITANGNASINPRTFTLVFDGCGSQIFGNLTITQDGAIPFLIVPAIIQVDHTEGLAVIDVASNTDWTAQENVAWLEMLAPTGGTGDAQVSVKHLANPDTLPRSGDVIFEFNGNQKTVTIWQMGGTVGIHDLDGNRRNRVVCVPNPAKESAWFLIHTDQSQTVHFDILAADGRSVTSLKNVEIKPGENTIPWQLSDLPAGQYSFRCFFEKEVVSGRIVVAR